MSKDFEPVPPLRRPSTPELVQTAEQRFKQHLAERAAEAHRKYHPLTAAKLEALLSDPDSARYPTRLTFESCELAPHQFAQPALDPSSPEPNGRVLYLRPVLRDYPELVVLAVAYMLPVLNYGEVVTDEHCLQFGATLLGLTPTEFYRQICALADFVGAKVLLTGPKSSSSPPDPVVEPADQSSSPSASARSKKKSP